MKPKAFDPIALEVFTHLAEQLGHGLHAVEQQELLAAEREHSAATDKQSCEAMSLMMEPMSLAMEMRDPYTAGHQKRVAEIAVIIASEMGWSSRGKRDCASCTIRETPARDRYFGSGPETVESSLP
jgi:response regulator RpfG family c-di-GMP phosphodiesterase